MPEGLHSEPSAQASAGSARRSVLIIAYYFPPMGGSGVQRPVKLAKYLPDFGWDPVILAPEPGAYYHFDAHLAEEISSRNIPVTRVKAKTMFHMAASVAGGGQVNVQPKEWKTRLLSLLTSWFFLPDNKTGWIAPALEQARKLITRHNIKAVIATAPPYSNLLLAARIREEFQIPVIMDFRDEWLHSHWISYPIRWHFRRMQQIEARTLATADAVTVVNASYAKTIGGRAAAEGVKAIEVIPNGYDPEDFERASGPDKGAGLGEDGARFTLLHSGRFYSGIQPDALLRSVSRFLSQNPEKRSLFRLQFQGGLTDAHHKAIRKYQLSDITEDLGYLPHDKAVVNLLRADALFLTLGQIPKIEAVTPGKIFEYIGSGKPVLAFLPEGISKELMEAYGAAFLANLTDTEQQTDALGRLFQAWENRHLPRPESRFRQKFDRRKIAGQFAALLSEVVAMQGECQTDQRILRN